MFLYYSQLKLEYINCKQFFLSFLILYYNKKLLNKMENFSLTFSPIQNYPLFSNSQIDL
jgi:hypothetical protein